MKDYKFILKLQSHTFDDPNTIYESFPISLVELLTDRSCSQIDFTDGSYIMLKELDIEDIIDIQFLES